MNRRKQVTVITLLAAFTCISIAATKPKPVTQDDGFKNLKVLPKDISKDQLDKIMHGFNDALGVHCNFCHAGNPAEHKMDFASDEKPEKDIARSMMKMTHAINTQYFNFENSTMPDTISVVKCVTCHRQNPHPDEAMMGGDHQGPPPGGMQPPPPPGQEMPPMDSTHQGMGVDSTHH